MPPGLAHNGALMALLNFEKAQSAVIARALIPLDSVGGTSRAIDVGEGLSCHLDHSPWLPALLVRLSLLLVWFCPVVVLGRPRTFGGLEPEQRAECLELLLASSRYVVRELMLLLKASLCMVVLGHEDVLRFVGAYRLDMHSHASGGEPVGKPHHLVVLGPGAGSGTGPGPEYPATEDSR